MIELRITSAEFHEWQNHPVTKKFYKEILECRAKAAEELILGGTIEKKFSREKTARKVGYIEGLDEALTITIINEEENV